MTLAGVILFVVCNEATGVSRVTSVARQCHRSLARLFVLFVHAADVYGHQHPTLPCMTMLANGHLPPPPAGLVHPHSYRHLNRSPVPPYRSSDASSAVYSDTYSSKNVIPSPTARWNNNKKPRNPNHRFVCLITLRALRDFLAIVPPLLRLMR